MIINKTIFSWVGVIFIIVLWQWASSFNPTIVLPSVNETLTRLYEIILYENGIKDIYITIIRALIGFSFALVIGIIIGCLSGYFQSVEYFLYPIERIMISIPPIAWIVLSLIWFGGNGITSPALTIFVAEFPLIYLSTMQAVKTIDRDLFDMAKSFNMKKLEIIVHIGGIHILSLIYPAITMSFGASWKIAVMAELLGSPNGIGSQIANARVNLETPDVFAWIAIIVIIYLIFDKILINPLLKYTMKWRKGF